MHSDPVIVALQNRVSVGELMDPAPAGADREAIFRAALRAPDHGQLRPWRFLLVEGEQRVAVGRLLAETEDACFGPLTDSQRSKAADRLLRAPLVLLVVARITPHAKVPDIEQVMSTACAVQNMLLAAQALGFGAMWRTGLVTFEPLLAEKLGLTADERLLGFLYLGTPKGEAKAAPAPSVDKHFVAWQAP